jgi:hypothetical protein
LMQIEELEGKTPKNLWEEDVNELLKALKWDHKNAIQLE